MMGRRKIEIKAIKDDRNRSVTFLKRKGGLFKKAHELSVLCSVDVAVIIFGHNKKLYEFSSGDINDTIARYQYYGQPHEHKGPADFRGKGGGDDDDDDDEDMSLPREDSIPPQQPSQMMPPHIQHQPAFGNLRNAGPSASPPNQNGMFAVPQGSPRPQMTSRPSSRDNLRRSSAGLVPMQHPRASTPQPGQNGFAFVQNQPMYDPRSHPNLNPPPTAPPQFQHFPHRSPPQSVHQPPQHLQQPPQHHQQQEQQQQQQQHQEQQQRQHQQYLNQQHQPPHPHHVQHPPPPQPAQAAQAHQAHQAFLQEQRRQSMPPSVPQQERAPPPTPPIQHEQVSSTPPPRPSQQSLRPSEHQSPPQPKHLSTKSRSIFTPIDASGSVLASHFFGRSPDPPRTEVKEERNSPGPKSRPRHQASASRSNTHLARTSTMSSDGIVPPSRSNTASSIKSAAARPRLKVQIPSEASDAESGSPEGSSPAGLNQTSGGVNSTGPAVAGTEGGATGGGSGGGGGGTAAATTPSSRRRSDSHHSSGVVLPAPSPSASALLSAGASGPPNPFARPPPPPQSNPSQQNSNAYADNRNNIETPVSALPSRFVADNLLPSPSSFYPDWGFGGGRSSGGAGAHDSGMLPSPLTFPTPVVSVGAPQGWGRPGAGQGAGDSAAASTGTGVGAGTAGEKRKGSAGDEGTTHKTNSNHRAEGNESKKVRV